jgi:hypothetical protein
MEKAQAKKENSKFQNLHQLVELIYIIPAFAGTTMSAGEL